MTPQEVERLKALAARYVWWKTAEQAIVFPERVAAQVMNLGAYDDVQLLEQIMGVEVLKQVLRGAEAGQFTPRSWHYWHYRLGLSRPGEVPPLPVRKTA